MVISGWAFGNGYPLMKAGAHRSLWVSQAIAYAMYGTYYNLMFPVVGPVGSARSLCGLLGQGAGPARSRGPAGA